MNRRMLVTRWGSLKSRTILGMMLQTPDDAINATGLSAASSGDGLPLLCQAGESIEKSNHTTYAATYRL